MRYRICTKRRFKFDFAHGIALLSDFLHCTAKKASAVHLQRPNDAQTNAYIHYPVAVI